MKNSPSITRCILSTLAWLVGIVAVATLAGP